MTRHWTEDDCIDRVYGIGRTDEHLSECIECRAMWQRFEARRIEIRTGFEQAGARIRVPAFEGVEAGRRRMRPKLIPALAGAGIVAAVLLVVNPAPQPPSPIASNSAVVSAADAQFFDEVAALDESAEPRAVRTAEALFEDTEN